MARGVKGSIDFEAKISMIDERIEKLNNSIATLKAERQELIAKKQEAEMKTLNTFLETNNMTIDDVINWLTPKPKLEVV